MKEIGSWVTMFVFGILCIIMGFQGSLGKVLGCILTPSLIERNDTNG